MIKICRFGKKYRDTNFVRVKVCVYVRVLVNRLVNEYVCERMIYLLKYSSNILPLLYIVLSQFMPISIIIFEIYMPGNASCPFLLFHKISPRKIYKAIKFMFKSFLDKDEKDKKENASNNKNRKNVYIWLKMRERNDDALYILHRCNIMQYATF